MNKIKIFIASVSDREKLVAELWCGDEQIAEINQESSSLSIEFYYIENKSFDLEEFLEALAEAKSKLLK